MLVISDGSFFRDVLLNDGNISSVLVIFEHLEKPNTKRSIFLSNTSLNRSSQAFFQET